mmetsp:Transcript_47786/g.118355  ORF Transcript_47786/g.118355 Transcript_47786/m.118355 type:complete len:107 (-) Transcript_47786:25-345(-)
MVHPTLEKAVANWRIVNTVEAQVSAKLTIALPMWPIPQDSTKAAIHKVHLAHVDMMYCRFVDSTTSFGWSWQAKCMIWMGMMKYASEMMASAQRMKGSALMLDNAA